MRVFTASRLSEGNVLFPAQVIIDDSGVLLKHPDILSKDDIFLPYDEISGIRITSWRIGFTTIIFYARGSSISAHEAAFPVHGFLRRDAETIRRLVLEQQG